MRLRVLKASRFLFECADVDPADAAQLQRLALVAVRAEEMAALGCGGLEGAGGLWRLCC